MIRRRPSARADAPTAQPLSGVLIAGLRDALRMRPMKKSAYTRLLAMGLVEKVPDRFSRLTAKGMRVLRECDHG